MNLALLQVTSTPIVTGLPIPVMLIFKRPISGLLPIKNRQSININNDDTHYKTLKYIKTNTFRTLILAKIHFSFPERSTVAKA